MDRVKEFRARWGLTQQEVSAMLGVKQPAWHTWETGKREVPEYVVKEMAFFERLSKREQDKELRCVREG